MSVPGVIGDLSDDTQDFPHPLAYRYPTEDAEVVVQDAAWRLTARAMPGRLRSRGGEQAGLDQQTPAGEGADRMAVSVEDYEPLSNLWNDPAARRPASSTRTAATGFKAAAVRLVGLEAIVASLIVLSSFCLAHARGVGFLPQTRAVAERLSIGLGGYVGLGGLALIVVAVLYAVERILRSSPRAGRQEEPADIPQEQVATVGNYLVQAIRERKLSLARSSQIVKAFIVREAYGRRLRADALLPDAAGSLACCLVLLGAPLTIIGLLVPDAGGASAAGPAGGEVKWRFPNLGMALAVATLLGLAGAILAVVGTLSPRLRGDVEAAERRLGAAYLVSSDPELAEAVNSNGPRATLQDLQDGEWRTGSSQQSRLASWFSSQAPYQLLLWCASTVVLIVTLAVTVSATGLRIGPAIAVAALLVGLSGGLVAAIHFAVGNRVLAHADAICHCGVRRGLEAWVLWPCLLFVALGWAMLPVALVVGAENGQFALFVCALHVIIFVGLVFGTGVVRYDGDRRRITCVRYHTYAELRSRLEESVEILAGIDLHTSRRRRPQPQQPQQAQQAQRIQQVGYGYGYAAGGGIAQDAPRSGRSGQAPAAVPANPSPGRRQ